MRVFISCLPDETINQVCKEAHHEVRRVMRRHDGGFQVFWNYRGYSVNFGLAGFIELSPVRPHRTLLLLLDSHLTPERQAINARIGRPRCPPEWLNKLLTNLGDDVWVCWACEKAHSRDMAKLNGTKCYLCQRDLDLIRYRG